MKLSNEKKFFTAVLVIYWMCLLLLTHIPIPPWVRNMGVSDKTMHFAAYMVLTLLIWLASSFDLKANWFTLRPWLVLFIILLSGMADEITQKFIAGRSCDIDDLAADMVGAAAAMLLVTFAIGYRITMIIIIISPIFLPAIVRSRLIQQGSILDEIVYFLGFSFITAMWIYYLSLIQKLDFKKFSNALLFFICPSSSVLVIKLYAFFTDKPFGLSEISIAFSAIILTLIGWRIAKKLFNV